MQVPAAAEVIAIATRSARRAPMQEQQMAQISVAEGVVGDHKGARHPRRQITLLAAEDWAAALAGLDSGLGAVDLPWTARRANILTRGIALPRGKGSRIVLGSVEIEVTGVTYPCQRMNEVHPGLLKALAVDGRGGVTARVVSGGAIELGARVQILLAIPERRPKLP